MRARPTQRGFLLIAAVIIIAVAAAMAAVILTLTAGSGQSGGRHVTSTQALDIATSGLGRGIRAVVSPILDITAPLDPDRRRICDATLPGDPSVSNIAVGQGTYSVTGAVLTSPAASTTLNAALAAGATMVRVGSVVGYAANGGRIMVDRELIDYSRALVGAANCAGSPACFVGAQRGRDATADVAHVAGTRVGQYQCTLSVRGGVPDLVSADRSERQLTQAVQIQNGWAVGAGGNFFRWNGTTWVAFAPAAPNQLNSVSMLSYSDGWAVGNNAGGELIMRWNGAVWARVGPIGAIPNTNLNSVYCIAANDCWIVGNNSGGETILRWLGGPNWARMAVQGPIPNQNLNGVFCVATNDCWAVGNNHGGGGGAAAGETILRWLGGAAWGRVGPIAAIPDTPLNSVHCVATNDCWIVGNNSGGETILRWLGGPNWARMAVQGPIPNQNLNGVFCVATNDCWAVGNNHGGGGGAAAGETILRWQGGPAWVRVGPSAAIPDVPLLGVTCTKTDDCWIVGNVAAGAELLLHWDGTAWTRWPPQGALPNQAMRSVYIIGHRQGAESAWAEVFP
jgi:hypothetical protein